MLGSHGTLCINSFYPETELNITEIQEYEKHLNKPMKCWWIVLLQPNDQKDMVADDGMLYETTKKQQIDVE